MPVVPKDVAGTYFDGGFVDHKLALLVNSNLVSRIKTPNSLRVSPIVVFLFPAFNNSTFVHLHIMSNWSEGNIRRK
jgi:hypothetical protein